jgi:hypothetical protein
MPAPGLHRQCIYLRQYRLASGADSLKRRHGRFTRGEPIHGDGLKRHLTAGQVLVDADIVAAFPTFCLDGCL